MLNIPNIGKMIYPAVYDRLKEYIPVVNSALLEVSELDVVSRCVLQSCTTNYETIDDVSMNKIQAVIDYMYEQVNIGNWKEVKVHLRKTITVATYLKLLSTIKCSDETSEDSDRELFKTIDFGILFGCPLDTEPQLLQKCADILKPISDMYLDLPQASVSLQIENIKPEATTIPLEVIDCPSLEYFYKNHITAQKPVVLSNCINHWPALTKWKDQNYFIKLAGLRTIPVELGKDYTDSKWTQKLMTMEEFVKYHIYETDGTTGYLAQYQLFDQIPELKKDISEPDYCSFSEKDDPVDIMAWYGPKGTVSPLHHDPKKNLLAQVVGQKQIYLFSPSDTEHLYPHTHELLNNTARIDPRKPDFDKFPKYKDAKPYCCILNAGQMLYIPPKWWHFVESLSVSFSVSFWWK